MAWDRFHTLLGSLSLAATWGGALVLSACASKEPNTKDRDVPNAGTGGSGLGGSAGAQTGGTGGAAAGTGGSAGGFAGTGGAGGAGGAASGAGGVSAGGTSGASSGGGAGTPGGMSGGAGLGGMSGSGASSGAAGDGAGMSGMGGMPGSTCMSGMQDGDETGVDCGGSCDECVIYRIDPPMEMNPNARSACESGGSGFMCPQSMALSPQMIQAAKDDWNSADPPFVYGVVGHDPDPGGVDEQSSNYASTCCQCYQLVFKGPTDGNVSVPAPKPMIVQAFNTYAGGPTAFDIYMAVGGHGNFNGCTENGAMYSMYPDTGGDWSGGVRATRYSQCSNMGYTEASIGSAMCQDFIAAECNKITAGEPAQSISRQSCIETNRVDTHYHMNWNVVVKRVECPENLTRVTGCRLNSQGLPEGDPEIDTVSEAMSNGFRDNGYHTTTMQDCCRPTCAWPDNTQNTMGEYSLFYSCNQQGEPYTE